MIRRLFLALALAAPASAQITLVAHTTLNYNGGGPGTTAAINTTGATMIAACATGIEPYAVGLSDSAGNVWQQAVSYHGANQINTLFYVFAPITSASHTFTISGGYPGGAIAAYTGVASGPDKTSGAGDSGSPQAGGAIAPTNADELILSCFSGATTATVASPMTVIDPTPTGDNNVAAVFAQQIQTTATSVNPTWSSAAYNNVVASASFFSSAAPAPLAVPAFTLPEAFVGTAYSFTIPASGGVSPNTCALTSGTLPSGFSLSGCAVTASSPPAASSTSGLVFRVTDSQSHVASSAAVTLTVAAAHLSMATSCPSGTQLATYAGCNLNPTGGTTPYTVAYLTDRNHVGIPEGLTLTASTGVLAGTLTGEGVYGTTYTLTDAIGTVLTQQVSIAVTGNNTFGGMSLFPYDNLFHGGFDLTALPVDTAVYTGPLAGHIGLTGPSSVGNDGGIPLNYVPATQPNIAVSCPGSTCYQNPVTSGPFSASTAIENTQNQSSAYNYITDGHAVILQAGGNGHPPMLYESYNSQYDAVHNAWQDVSNFSWDLTAYSWVNGAGSTDAAGLPILSFVLNYDDVMKAGGFTRLIRFTIPQAQTFQYHVWPATDQAGGGGSLTGGYQDPTYNALLLQSNPPTASVGGGTTTTVGGTSTRAVYGGIWRVKASYFASPGASCLTNTSTNPQAASIFYSMRHTGMILADNGAGIDMQMTDDPRWSASDLACLYNIPGSALEQVNMTSLITADSNGVPLNMRVKGAAPIPAPFISGSQSTGGLNQW